MAIRKVLGGGGVSYSSGGATNNVIPKNDGAGGLKDSLLTDDGTTVTDAGNLTLAAAKQLIVNNSGSSGILYQNGSGVTTFTLGRDASTGGFTLGASAGDAIVQAGGSAGNVKLLASNSNKDIYFVPTGVTRVGDVAAASPAARILQIGESSRGGTDSNVAGAAGSLRPGIGTGTGAASKLAVQRNLMGASGSVAQTQVDAYAVGQSKTLSNTTATAQTIATITLGSNAGGGCAGTFTLVATDGTNFDAETQSFNVSFVNKAGAVTVGSVVVTATTAANNSGSATLGLTAVANGNNIDIKVTPVFTTIVPTTVTLYPVISHSTNTVTFA